MALSRTRAECPWWARWLHRRKRQTDFAAMWIPLVHQSSTVSQARAEWEAFVEQPGQEHWRCPCGVEFAAVMRSVLFRVDANESEAEA